MVVIESYLREADRLVPIVELERYRGRLEYVEGLLRLEVDGVELIGWRDQDLVDQLWSYLLEGLRVVLVEQGEFDGFFPDQPLPIRMRRMPRDRILLRVGKRFVMTPLGTFADGFVAGAFVFCDALARLTGERHVAPIREQALLLCAHLEHSGLRRDVAYRPQWSVEELIAAHHAARDCGGRLVCHRCGAALVVAVTAEEARRQGIHGGVFCPENQNHVGMLMDF